MKNPNQIGGKGVYTAIKQREDAKRKYLENPSLCKCCQKIILPTEKQQFCEMKKKSFCNTSCAAKFNNSINPKRKKSKKERIVRKSIHDNVQNLTKGELFDNSKNWQTARTKIRKHAAFLFPKEKLKKCFCCEYSNHVEICHIKSVSSFSKDSLLSEINDPSNLIGLCPNCHWEFDNGLLTESQLKMDAGVGFEPTKPDLMRVGGAPALPAR